MGKRECNNIYCSTEIESAIIQREQKKFNSLIQKSDLDYRSDNGSTLLHKAETGCRIELAEELITRGIEIDAKDEAGYTALHRALENERWDFAELLLKHGADANTINTYGVSPLHSTIRHARRDNKFVTMLLENGANPQRSGPSGTSPLEMARELEYTDIVALLESNIDSDSSL